jgi:hypothetical protein
MVGAGAASIFDPKPHENEASHVLFNCFHLLTKRQYLRNGALYVNLNNCNIQFNENIWYLHKRRE